MDLFGLTSALTSVVIMWPWSGLGDHWIHPEWLVDWGVGKGLTKSEDHQYLDYFILIAVKYLEP